MSLVETIINDLRLRPSSYRCRELVRALENLGYSVRSGKAANHKIYVHKGTRNFSGGNFNCGHGRNPFVQSTYVNNVASELERAQDDLRKFLGSQP